MKFTAVALSVACLLLAMCVRVQAATKGTLEVAPAFIDVTLAKPGEEKKIPITYINHSDKSIRLQLFTIDLKQKDSNGIPSFINESGTSLSYSLSSFLRLETESVSVDPNEKRIVNVSALNRDDLSPGGHYAAVIARVMSDEPTAGKTTVSPSVSTTILLRKSGGESFNLSLKSSNWPAAWLVFGYPSVVSLEFQNEGNIHLIPYGRVEINDLFGRMLFKGVINENSLYVFPETRRLITSNLRPIEQSFPISVNVMNVSGNDSLKKTTFIYKSTFVYINPWLIVGLIVLAGVLYRVVGMWKRRKKVRS